MQTASMKLPLEILCSVALKSWPDRDQVHGASEMHASAEDPKRVIMSFNILVYSFSVN